MSYTMLITALAPQLKRYLHMDVMSITMILSYLPVLYQTDFEIHCSYWWSATLPLAMLCYWWWCRRTRKTKTLKTKEYDYSEAIIYDSKFINQICGLINLRKDLFPKNIQISVHTASWYLEEGFVVSFRDDENKVEGYIVAENRNVNRTFTSTTGELKTSTVNMNCIVLRVNRGDKSAVDYMKTMCDMYDTALRRDTSSRYVVMSNAEVSVYGTMSPSNVQDLEAYKKRMVETYINTFISKHRDHLWGRIQQIEQHPEVYANRGETTSISYIMHGPAGTGKSTWPYRVARATMRHLVRINLKNFTHTPVRLNKILTVGMGKYTPSQCVCVLEEFDAFITEIVRIEQNTNKSTDLSNEPRKTMVLKDLLTAFDGPYPVQGRIIFANTNNIELIHEHLPQLIRQGRLNPIEFEYWDENEFTNYVRHRYGRAPSKKLLRKSSIYDHSPSGIIEYGRDRTYTEFEKGFKPND